MTEQTGPLDQFRHPPRRIDWLGHNVSSGTPSATDIDVDERQISRLAHLVTGGSDNLQEAYPLTPLQEGLLFHHLLNPETDAYVLSTLLELESGALLDALLCAVQSVIDRHDILRAAIAWEDLPRPLHVVHRKAILRAEKFSLHPDRDVFAQLEERMRPHRKSWNLQRPPLVTVQVAPDPRSPKWYALLQLHHIICDYGSLRTFVAEVAAHINGTTANLPRPQPYRDHVKRALAHLRLEDAERFFGGKLAEVTAPTVPFGAVISHREGRFIREHKEEMDPQLAVSLRSRARSLRVSPARLFHAAWALVIAHTSGRNDIVFGTVILSNWQRLDPEPPYLGLSINTLPLRLRLRGSSVKELIEQTHRELTELLQYEQVPLVIAQRCAAIDPSTQLFGALLNFRHASSGPLSQWATVPGIRVLCAPEAQTNYPVALTVDDLGTGFALTMQTCGQVDPHRMTGYVSTVMRSLLDALEFSPEADALSLTILPATERETLLRTFNTTDTALPEDTLVHDLFEDQVRQTPDAIAVVHDGQQTTYAELNRRGNQLARYLSNQGIAPDQPVGICVDRGLEMIVGLLAILKAGGAYVPLDPSHPAERLRYILEDSAPTTVLTQGELLPSLPSMKAEIIDLHQQMKKISANVDENLSAGELGLEARSLVYVIYTSGSTGRPKGTAMSHRSMVNLIEWHRRTFSECAGVRVLQFATLTFDVAFQEIFSTLCTGGTLVLPDEWVRKDTRALLSLINDQLIQRLFVPPLMLQSLADCARTTGSVPGTLQDVITAGDRLRVSAEVCSFFNRIPGCRLHNHYGPTETHVATALTLTGTADEWPLFPSIGRPIANVQLYVLDTDGRPAPIGVSGEIYIGGAGVARGYLGKSELTSLRFIRDPFRGAQGARMYGTGDLGRWRPDGTLDYLGRNDFQIKLRGYRVEPGEVEAQLLLHRLIKDAVVIARDDPTGQKRLVAYVTCRKEERPSIEQLRAHLKTTLPDHMVPSAIVLLEELPQTPSGKLDRRSLPAPELGSYATSHYDPPQGPVEELLAGLWQDLLHIERVGRNDNFFELGGHSLLIVRMLDKLRQLGMATEVHRVFEHPILSDMAESLIASVFGTSHVPANLIPAGCETITPQMLPLVHLQPRHIEQITGTIPGGAANLQDVYPLTPLQEGMLFHHLRSGHGGDSYLLPVLVSLESRSRLQELVSALQQVMARHDALRTAVLWEPLPHPIQVVYRHATLPVEEIALDQERDPIEQFHELMVPQGHVLDLTQAPLLRLRVAPDPGSARWYALLQIHHLVCDNVSLDMMLREVMAHLTGHESQLPEPGTYRAHVAHILARSRRVDHEGHFRTRLADVTEPTLPFGLGNIHVAPLETSSTREILDRTVATGLRARARTLGVTAATLFHSAWALVVSSASGRDDVVFGSVLLGRLQGSAGAQPTLGMFINTLPLRLRLQGVSAQGLVDQTQRELIELLHHEDASLAIAQRCSGIPGATPLFSTLLNYRHKTLDLLHEFASTPGLEILAARSWTNYPVLLSIDEVGDGFALTAQTDRRIDPRRVIAYTSEALRALLGALETAPDTDARRLSILPASEAAEILRTFNTTSAAFPREKLVHELFEDQVAQRPDSTAAVHNGKQLSYAELNRRANQLARILRNQGIGPDEPVGLFVERGLEMVVGLLGILKAGGAYVPLDPNYPVERLQQMKADAAVRIILSHGALVDSPPFSDTTLIALDEQPKEISGNHEENLSASELGLNAEHLVYVIYTSGSTGRPKGAAMAHRSMVNLIWWHRRTLPDTPGTRVLQFAPLSFDVAFQEIFSTLCSGGTLILVDECIRKDIRALSEFLRDQSIQRLFIPPVILQMLAEYTGTQEALPVRLQDVIVAGEQLRISPEIASLFRKLSACRLHNHYGPTETHVATTHTMADSTEQWPALPPVGRPIANTQIYVLDTERQPVPIGVTAEICIGGIGLARGYFGSPELTAQRFFPDPFSTAPGARLYGTGDLGRWTPDGTLEYVGRADSQIKLRGYRIELGEIESHLLRHDRIKDAVVVVREDEPGHKHMVAYVTLRESGNATVEELRAHLKCALPEYMLPAAIVFLDHLPLSPNGKLNRLSLPAPTLDAYAKQGYEAPEGEVEDILARIWCDVLGIPQVGRNDDFFDLGGHSLLVIKALARINQSLSCTLRVTDVYQNPSLRGLAGQISGKSHLDPPLDLSTEADLDPIVTSPTAPPRTPPRSTLVTGATGFVGRFLISQLLQDPDATIYCLVRSNSEHEAAVRVRASLTRWDLWHAGYAGRIVAIPGDLRKPRLGLSENHYRTVIDETDSIFHCGASVNHLESYAAARNANVYGTHEVLKIATHGATKPLNYISTLGIFTNHDGVAARVVTEESPIEREIHRRSTGYIASKWVAEGMIMKARARGVPCNIFRLGLLWADSRCGRFDEAQHVYRLIKSCLLSGCGIAGYRYHDPPVPVDRAIRAIVSLAAIHHGRQRVFHIGSSSAQPLECLFERCNEVLDSPLTLMPHYEWVGEIKRLHRAGRSLPIVPLIDVTFSMNRREFAEHHRRTEANRVGVDCQRTIGELERADVSPPRFTSELIAVCLQGMIARDADLAALRAGTWRPSVRTP